MFEARVLVDTKKDELKIKDPSKKKAPRVGRVFGRPQASTFAPVPGPQDQREMRRWIRDTPGASVSYWSSGEKNAGL